MAPCWVGGEGTRTSTYNISPYRQYHTFIDVDHESKAIDDTPEDFFSFLMTVTTVSPGTRSSLRNQRATDARLISSFVKAGSEICNTIYDCDRLAIRIKEKEDEAVVMAKIFFHTSSGIAKYTTEESLRCSGHTGEPLRIAPGHSFDSMTTAEVTYRRLAHTRRLSGCPITRTVNK